MHGGREGAREREREGARVGISNTKTCHIYSQSPAPFSSHAQPYLLTRTPTGTASQESGASDTAHSEGAHGRIESSWQPSLESAWQPSLACACISYLSSGSSLVVLSLAYLSCFYAPASRLSMLPRLCVCLCSRQRASVHARLCLSL